MELSASDFLGASLVLKRGLTTGNQIQAHILYQVAYDIVWAKSSISRESLVRWPDPSRFSTMCNQQSRISAWAINSIVSMQTSESWSVCKNMLEIMKSVHGNALVWMQSVVSMIYKYHPPSGAYTSHWLADIMYADGPGLCDTDISDGHPLGPTDDRGVALECSRGAPWWPGDEGAT